MRYFTSNEIWNIVKGLLKLKFTASPIRDDKYILYIYIYNIYYIKTYKILSATSLFNLNFFQYLLVYGKSISFQLYSSIKGLILNIL